MIKINKKAVALLLVMVTVLITVLLANIVLGIVSSQSRLTRHQVGRIQAYYAAMAGANYAYEMLRRGPANGGWVIPPPNRTQILCANAALPGCAGPGVLIDATLPGSIQMVTIRVRQAGSPAIPPNVLACNPPAGIPACITSNVNYAYQ